MEIPATLKEYQRQLAQAYNEGYDEGHADGWKESSRAADNGFSMDRYDEGYRRGYQDGVARHSDEP